MRLRSLLRARWTCALLLVAACHADRGPLRVGLLVWPPYELLHVAESRGYFGEQPVELVDYSTPAAVMRAYENGVVDAVALTSTFLNALGVADPEQRVVLVVDFSAGGDALVGRPGVDDLVSLRGGRVGMEQSSLAGFVLMQALAREGVDLSEVEVVPLDLPDQAAAFERGDVDAMVTYEPIVTELVQQGGSVLFDSSQIPGEIVDVLITNAAVIERRAPELQALVDGFFLALEEFRSDPDAVAETAARREGITPDEFLAALALAHVPDAAENLELLEGDDGLLPHLGRMREFHTSRGRRLAEFDLESLLEPRFVREALDAP